MKVIIARSRTITDRKRVFDHIELVSKTIKITEVVSGKCPTGVDKFGEEWAASKGIPVKPFPADWKKNGRAAGPIRNRQMAEYADLLIVVTTGDSKGSFNMIDEMNKLGKPVRWDMRGRGRAVSVEGEQCLAKN